MSDCTKKKQLDTFQLITIDQKAIRSYVNESEHS